MVLTTPISGEYGVQMAFSHGDEDAVAFVVDGTWWVKSARILAGQHAVMLAAIP
ncbi:hypothetical protein Tco_0065937, partial [Tanacetum coccineum]